MSRVRDAATAAEVTAILGRLDDDVMMRILATGATAAEVLEAYTWLAADDQIGTETERGPRGVAAGVFDILRREEAEAQEPR